MPSTESLIPPEDAQRARERVGKVIGERYRIERLLGQGGMGAVYEAVEIGTDKRVALKLLHESLLERQQHFDRFTHETLAVAMIVHPNVVQSLGAFSDANGAPVMVLELLDGEGLDARLKRGPLPVSEAVRIVREAAAGLAAAHAKGIVHRDLKPANVFLVESGQVKVLDFGVSRLNDPLSEEEARLRTTGGMILGTPHYMSPEQIQDAHAADQRADVYALAAIFYEMLAGWPPFRARSGPLLLVRAMSLAPPQLDEHRSDIPSDLARIVERGLAKSPSARIPTVGELAQALEPFAGISSPPPPVKPPPTEQELDEQLERMSTASVSPPPNPQVPPPALDPSADSDPSQSGRSSQDTRRLLFSIAAIVVLFLMAIAASAYWARR